MPRIAGVDVPPQKRGEVALTAIFGIGRSRAREILDQIDLGYDMHPGDWTEDQLKFKTRDFGKFTILTDTIPPSIRPLRKDQDLLSFLIEDELSGVATYEARINGKWILMNYDYKKDLIWSEKIDENIPFEGELILKIADNLGNENVYLTKI